MKTESPAFLNEKFCAKTLFSLRKMLELALSTEQYEEAALLRDEITYREAMLTEEKKSSIKEHILDAAKYLNQ